MSSAICRADGSLWGVLGDIQREKEAHNLVQAMKHFNDTEDSYRYHECLSAGKYVQVYMCIYICKCVLRTYSAKLWVKHNWSEVLLR